MNKKVFIIHGWGGFPEEGWFPWLKRELEKQEFVVNIPQLPDTNRPRIQPWVKKLSETVKKPDQHTYFVGHSLGCQTIARYLESLQKGMKIGGAVFVAGFFKKLDGVNDNTELETIANHWLNTPLDFEKVKSHIPKSIAIFSDNDPYVPLCNQDDFKNNLGSEIIIEHNKGHFSGPGDNITQLPIALQSILKISR